MAKPAYNLAQRARVATFADWERAAVAGYIKGGMRPEAADAVVLAAADDVKSLVTRSLTDGMFQTFLLALDLECGRFMRWHGAAFFVTRE